MTFLLGLSWYAGLKRPSADASLLADYREDFLFGLQDKPNIHPTSTRVKAAQISEDAVAAAAAERAKCAGIGTRDARGFSGSPVRAVTPEGAQALAV